MTEAARRARERRNFYLPRGICCQCGREWVAPGHTLCEACRDKHRESEARNDPGFERRKERKKVLREQRRAAGLCIDCGHPSEGHVRCLRCREMRRDSWRKWKILQRMDAEADARRGGVRV